MALQALAPGLSGTQLTSALEFLISRGLADSNSIIRDGMVAAGVAIVDAHGGANPGTMLPLFESYLDKKVGGWTQRNVGRHEASKRSYCCGAAHVLQPSSGSCAANLWRPVCHQSLCPVLPRRLDLLA